VALSGDGGDELFAGYTHYGLAAKIARFNWVPAGLFSALHAIANSGTRLADWCQRMSQTPDRRRLTLMRLPGRGQRRDVLSPAFRESREERGWFLWDLERELSGLPPTTQMQLLDVLCYLPNDMLVKVDRASMSVGLETRVPFLSPAVAELAFRIPEADRVDPRVEKPILRGLVKRYFGSDIASAPKHGFSIPRKSWLSEASGVATESQVACGAAVKEGVLDAAGIHQLFSDVRRGGGTWYTDRTEELFALLVFHHWWENYRFPNFSVGNSIGAAEVSNQLVF
jgi:asparagine synthase (glutamine-hydrolysing)